ncbi:MAG: S8 family serine peptidase [Candidatus Limnocylindria bacterium]
MRKLTFLAAVVTTLVAAASASAGSIPSRYVVVVEDGASAGRVAADHARYANAEVFHVYGHALNGYAARLSERGLARIRADSRVLFVSADREVHAVAQTLPTGIDRIDGEQSSTASGNGSGSVNVGVAVIDTGIDVDHPDLNVAGGTNCVRGRPTIDDGNGHGTHVAGTIAAKDDSTGVVGVVPGAQLWAVRVLNNQGSGSWSSVICGVDWVTANASSRGIEVANMSLGGTGSDDGNCGNSNNDALHEAICNSVAAGVTYVVAAGNDAADLKGFVPAAYDEVLSVSAVADFNGEPGGGAAATCRSDVDDTYADFSNFATLASDQAHTIAAPGVCILSTWRGGGYNTISGTSMASPHMAGTAALCIAVGECTGSPATIVQKLRGDAAAYNTADTGYGFHGDPIRPVSGKYFGYLTRAAEY